MSETEAHRSALKSVAFLALKRAEDYGVHYRATGDEDYRLISNALQQIGIRLQNEAKE